MGLFGEVLTVQRSTVTIAAMSDEPRYSLTELADLGGVTPRTVRYYLGQGLLPAVGPSGPGSKYGTTHLARLRLIRRLQAEHLPLAEIRRRLDDLDEAAIRDLAAQERPSPPQDSALDYLRGVLGPSVRSRSTAAPAASAAAMPAPASAATPEPAGRPLLARAPADAALSVPRGRRGARPHGPGRRRADTASHRTLPVGPHRHRPRRGDPHPTPARAGPAERDRPPRGDRP